MATVYSLLCFGGLSGKTVTFTDAGDVVNLIRHGMRQGVTGIIFSTTGSLPVGLTAGATYYPRDGADTGKFTLYPTKADALAGTNQVTFTGTGTGTHTVKSAYMLGLTAEQLARYGDSGNERVFSSIYNWNTGRGTTSPENIEVLEIGEDFIDDYGTSVCPAISVPASKTTIKPINNAGHNGIYGKGFTVLSTNTHTASGVVTLGRNVTLEGICILVQGIGSGLSLTYPGATAKSLFIMSTGVNPTSSYGVRRYEVSTNIINCVVTGFAYGESVYQLMKASVSSNNLFTKNNVGIYTAYTANISGFMFNNISAGNTVNYSAQPTGLEFSTRNAGVAGDSPWDTSGDGGVVLDPTDNYSQQFVDFLGNNYVPVALAASVDTGIEFYAVDPVDMAGNVRPNYEASTYPNNYWDIGPFEYDHGDGLVPIAATLAIAANVSLSGAEIRIYDADNTPAGTLGTELSGTESNPSTTYTYSAASLMNNTIYIQVMQSGYEEFLTSHTVTNINETLTLTLKTDVNA